MGAEACFIAMIVLLMERVNYECVCALIVVIIQYRQRGNLFLKVGSAF